MTTNTSKYYAYLRVSSKGQTVDAQRGAIEAMKYHVEDWVRDEAVSGKVPAMERAGFKALVSQLKAGDTVLASELSRIGRNTVDALNTIALLEAKGVYLEVAQLPSVRFGTPTGKLISTVMLAVVEMELSLKRERCSQGIDVAKSKGGIYLGRKQGSKNKVMSDKQKQIRRMIGTTSANNTTIAKVLGVHRITVIRARQALDEEKEAAFRAKYLSKGSKALEQAQEAA